jgi:hypothetical protein
VANAQHRDRRQQAASQSNKKRWRQNDIDRNLELTEPVKKVNVTGEPTWEEKQRSWGERQRLAAEAQLDGSKREPEKSPYAYWYHKARYTVRRIPREAAFKPEKEIKR